MWDIINKFNRGMVDPAAMARDDVEHVGDACELMENMIPERLGGMSLRPGTLHVGDTADQSMLIPFVRAYDDTNLIEFQPDGNHFKLRVWDSRQAVSHDATVSTTIADTSFTGSGGWVNADEASDCSSIVGPNYAALRGNLSASAKIYQTVTVAANDQGVDHTIRVEVQRGPILFQIGDSGVDSSNIVNLSLDTGEHYFTIAPTGDFTITFSNSGPVSYLKNCELVTGEMWLHASFLGYSITPFNDRTYWRKLRMTQSADVIYLCGDGYRPFMIRKYGQKSWGIQQYRNQFGPFGSVNQTDVTVTPSGSGTVTPSFDFSKKILSPGTKNYLGMLIKYITNGQLVTKSFVADNDATDHIVVFGTGTKRDIHVKITTTTGSFTSIVLEKSFDTVTWLTVVTYITDQDYTYNDGLDGAEVYYRLRVTGIGGATGTMSLDYQFGAITGEAMTVSESDEDTLYAAWYKQPGRLDPTRDWYFGEWGGPNPWPTSVTFFQGRLWFAGNNQVWGSVTDDYGSFDRDREGNDAAIKRTIGSGPVDNIYWLAATDALHFGMMSGEMTVASDNFGAVLTDLNSNLKMTSSFGAAPVAPVVLDRDVIFVQRGRDRLISKGYSFSTDGYNNVDLTLLNPSILKEKVTRIEITRHPETRIYCLLESGKLAVLTRDSAEAVNGWSVITLGNGTHYIRDICVLPSDGYDEVYIVTDRGGLVDRIEVFNTKENCEGGYNSYHFDNVVEVTTTVANELDVSSAFNNGDTVAVWRAGVDLGDFDVSAGKITGTGLNVGDAAIVGYRYTGKFKTAKVLQSPTNQERVLGRKKRITSVGSIMRLYVPGTLKIGPDFDTLTPFPSLEGGVAPSIGEYDHQSFEFDGETSTDPRICIEATGPVDMLMLGYNIEDAQSFPRGGQ